MCNKVTNVISFKKKKQNNEGNCEKSERMNSIIKIEKTRHVRTYLVQGGRRQILYVFDRDEICRLYVDTRTAFQ